MVDCGFVNFSNDAKRTMLGVKAITLATFGAVSKETATAMAIGALEKAGVDLAVSITGIAGPGGATPGKPVGLVHLAVAARDGRILHRECTASARSATSARVRVSARSSKRMTDADGATARGPQAPARERAPRSCASSRLRIVPGRALAAARPRRSSGAGRRAGVSIVIL